MRLQGRGVMLEAPGPQAVSVWFDEGRYVTAEPRAPMTPAELRALAVEGRFVGTLTAHLGPASDADHPQPVVWSPGVIHEQRGRQVFPTLSGEPAAMMLSGRHLMEGAQVLVNGRRVPGTVGCADAGPPPCADEQVRVELAALPAAGMHLLQVQNPGGLVSNDYIFFTE